MPAVNSKFFNFENPKGNITDKILFLLHKYKPAYLHFKKCSKKQLSFEAKAHISEFKMELMSLGLPKQIVNGLHSRMML